MTSITDEGIEYLRNSKMKLKYLSLSNCSKLTDKSLSHLEDAFSKTLLDLCLYGCYNVTDKGLMHVYIYIFKIGGTSVRFLNRSGCYKVSDGLLRYLFSANPRIRLYEKPYEWKSF